MVHASSYRLGAPPVEPVHPYADYTPRMIDGLESAVFIWYSVNYDVAESKVVALIVSGSL